MNLGMPEMIFIFLLALVVVGPRKLPEVGRQLGKFLAEFKRASNEFKNQLETEMLNIELEERAKKQQEEGPKVLPPERRDWDRPIMPVSGAVSRGNLELVADGDDSQVMKPLPPQNPESDHEASPARSAVSE